MPNCKNYAVMPEKRIRNGELVLKPGIRSWKPIIKTPHSAHGCFTARRHISECMTVNGYGKTILEAYIDLDRNFDKIAAWQAQLSKPVGKVTLIKKPWWKRLFSSEIYERELL